jgi:hypothetical protein
MGIEVNLPKSSMIGTWFMPSFVIDDINKFWENNKEKARKGQTGDNSMYVKDSMDISIGAYNFDEPFGSYRNELQKCLDQYCKTYPESDKQQQHFNIHANYNLQWYPKDGGFKTWHHENAGTLESIHRHLVFMTYLDDVPNGGTMFKYQNLKTPAKKGLTVIFPSSFTHVHKGEISKNHEKKILTGWYSYTDIFKMVNSATQN